MGSVVLAGCNADFQSNEVITPSNKADNQQQAVEIMKENTPAQVNFNIERLAERIAAEDPELASRALSRVARSSLGAIEENEVLIKDILSEQNARSLERSNSTSLRSVFTKDDIYGLVSSIPYASVYLFVPENYEGNNPDPKYIVAAQYPEDGDEVEMVNAWDFDGNVFQLSNEEEPDYPVLVIGMSEARHLADAMAKETSKSSSVTEVRSVDIGGKAHGTINHNEYISKMYIADDKEPWTKGSPEVYALWAVGKNLTKVHQTYDFVNKEKKWYNLNSYVFSYANWPNTMYYKVEFWENDWNWSADAKIVDGGYAYQNDNFDIEAKFNFSATFGDKDDFMGNTQMYFYHPVGGTFTTGNARFIASY